MKRRAGSANLKSSVGLKETGLRHLWGRLGVDRFCPVWCVVLAFVIGKRDQAGADVLLARVAHVTDDAFRCSPAISSRHIGTLCCTPTVNGITRNARAAGVLIPNRNGGHRPVCGTPRSSNGARADAL